jgi:hypothetical protein
MRITKWLVVFAAAIAASFPVKATPITYTLIGQGAPGHLGASLLGETDYTIVVLADTADIVDNSEVYSTPAESVTIDLNGELQVPPFQTVPFTDTLTVSEPAEISYNGAGIVISTPDTDTFPFLYDQPLPPSDWNFATSFGPVQYGVFLYGIDAPTDQGLFTTPIRCRLSKRNWVADRIHTGAGIGFLQALAVSPFWRSAAPL